ncbi:hypothetical protein T492DRAFT_408016 [Pavlovales sp. CCMP2436]|nr:hypothetical protein T492DRAFT_408016 [Pavlovales sp. CCMP2436]
MSIYWNQFAMASPFPQEVLVHSAVRIDVHAVVGERTQGRLVLRAPGNACTVDLFSSDELTLALSTSVPFDLLPNNPREVAFVVRPPLSARTPRREVLVHAVDVRSRSLVAAWLVCVRCVVPAISKTYDVNVVIGRNTSKKIALSNPYGLPRRFRLHCSRPDLISLKEKELTVPVGEFRYMGLRFSADSSLAPGVAEVLVLVNNEEDKNEECMLVRVAFVHEGGALPQPRTPARIERVAGELVDS